MSRNFEPFSVHFRTFLLRDNAACTCRGKPSSDHALQNAAANKDLVCVSTRNAARYRQELQCSRQRNWQLVLYLPYAETFWSKQTLRLTSVVQLQMERVLKPGGTLQLFVGDDEAGGILKTL